MKSICQRLKARLGGTWSYDSMGTWWCDDGKRRVSRCSPGVDQFDNPIPGCQYWLYGDGNPKRAEGYVHRHRPLPWLLP